MCRWYSPIDLINNIHLVIEHVLLTRLNMTGKTMTFNFMTFPNLVSIGPSHVSFTHYIGAMNTNRIAEHVGA